MTAYETDRREGVTLSSDSLTAFISPKGAELQILRDQGGVDYLWGGEPIWPRRSPLLFPIVGRLANNRFDYRGRSYVMSKHGFARDKIFEIVHVCANSARFALASDDSTRAVFPFDFLLEVEFALSGRRLDIRHGVTNLGSEDMYFSIGAHPAFRWPLGGAAKEQGQIRFERNEPAPVRRLVGGLIGRTEPSPVEGDRLSLRESLFTEDAIIFDGLESRSLVYSCGERSAELSWEGFEHLGLWSKPGADFLCIEPWRGYDSPIDFAGEFDQKPGIARAHPRERLDFTLSIRIG